MPIQLKTMKSFHALTLSGNIFRTLAINDIWDVLTNEKVKFNFVDWKIGNNEFENSSCVLQIFADTRQ